MIRLFHFTPRMLVVVALIGFAAGALAEDALRAKEDEPGFCRFAGTLSPDGHYVLGWAPKDLSEEALATLKEWDPKAEFKTVNENVMNFLMDAPRGKVLMKIPDFAYWAGQGWRQNRHDLIVAWSADSRSSLAIYEGRWDDEDVVWIDAAAGRVTSVNKQMLDAFYGVLRSREKQKEAVSTQFDDAAILPGGLLVVSAFAWIPKEGPGWNYRLTYRMATKGGKVRLELLKARKLPEDEQRPNSAQPEGALNAAYEKLRGRLDEKARAALKTEELVWLIWRESVPEASRQGVTAQRAALLKARAE